MERQIIKKRTQNRKFVNSIVRVEWMYRESEFMTTSSGSRYFSLRKILELTATNGIGRFLLRGRSIILLTIFLFASCQQVEKQKTNLPIEEPKKSMATLKQELTDKGFQIFDYVDEETKDTVLMQQYFIAFLKRGPERSQNKAATDSLQALHMAHLGRMYELGYADISGPFGDDGDIRGITIYNVPTLQMADSLANLDPSVQAGRLEIEVHPWWAAKGFPLR